jgi:hypothetical protein
MKPDPDALSFLMGVGCSCAVVAIAVVLRLIFTGWEGLINP